MWEEGGNTKTMHRAKPTALLYRQNGTFGIQVDDQRYPVGTKGELLKEVRRYHNTGYDVVYRGFPPDVASDITRIIKR